MKDIILRPDAKGKISLGEYVQGISSYRATIEEDGRIILQPYTEIPYSEKWIFDSPEILQKLKQQLKADQTK